MRLANWDAFMPNSSRNDLDCKTVGFFLKISKEIGIAFSASFQTFCLTARAYLNTQKYGLFCSLEMTGKSQYFTSF